jgi:hypothetical protein
MLPAFPHTVYASLGVHDRGRGGKTVSRTIRSYQA